MDILIKILEREVLESRITEFVRILSGEPHEYWEEDHFRKDLPGKFDLSIVAMKGDLIAGYIIASLKNEGPYIHKFMVHNDMRGKLLGEKMLQFFESNALNKGYNSVTLTVIEENEAAIRFYKRHDFIISGRKKATDGNYYLLVMTKSLS
jgi:ribosomal protein S18 acetylase RimI-like enzyme